MLLLKVADLLRPGGSLANDLVHFFHIILGRLALVYCFNHRRRVLLPKFDVVFKAVEGIGGELVEELLELAAIRGGMLPESYSSS